MALKNALLLTTALSSVGLTYTKTRYASPYEIRGLIDNVIHPCDGGIISEDRKEKVTRVHLHHNSERHRCPKRDKVTQRIINGCRIAAIQCIEWPRKDICAKFYIDIECKK